MKLVKENFKEIDGNDKKQRVFISEKFIISTQMAIADQGRVMSIVQIQKTRK